MLCHVIGERVTDLCLLTAYSRLQLKQDRPQTRIISARVKNASAEYFFPCVLILGDNACSEAEMANKRAFTHE